MVLCAKQLTDRLVEGLARNIPERNISARKHVHARTLPTIIGEIPVHLLPQALSLQRILADQRLPERLEADGAARGSIYDRFADMRLGFDVGPARNPLVGTD